MKRKLISSLILSFLISVSFVLPVKAVNISYNTENTSVVQEKDYSELNKIIKEKAGALCSKYGAASVQYAISDGDDIIVSDNVVADGINTKVNNDTMYGIASVSKIFLTTAVMQLVDEGKVDLDMPVTLYVPDFKMKDDRYKKITVRMLLNHSSGLMGCEYGNLSLMNDVDSTNHDKLLETLSKQRLKAEPGEFSVYCNDGFSLAEILVERVSGMTFTDYIREKISEPLKLTNTKTPFNDFDWNRLADTFFFDGENKDPHEFIMSLGTAGLFSSAEDLCKFQRGISRKDGHSIISQKSQEAMASAEYLKGVWVTDGEDNTINYGLGWDSVNLFPFNRYNIKALCKGGDAYSSHSSIITFPDYDISVAVVTSGCNSGYDRQLASDAAMEVLKYKEIIKEDKILPDLQWDSEFSQSMPMYLKDEFEGYYVSNGAIYKADINEDGELKLYIAGHPEAASIFKHTYSNYFMPVNKVKDFNIGIRFVKEKNGKVYLEQKIVSKEEPFGQSVTSVYIGQKENIIENTINKDWSEREKKYYLVNQKYSYWFNGYNLGMLTFGSKLNDGNLINQNRIITDNEAQTFINIPGAVGRDLSDYEYTNEEGKEYVTCDNRKYVREDCIPYLTSDIKEVKIDNNGYAKWMFVPEGLEGKTITVKSNKKSCFSAYNKKNGMCIGCSYLYNRDSSDIYESTFKLNSEYVLCFIGDKDETFEVSIN